MSMSIEQMYLEDEKRSAERAANKGTTKYYNELKIKAVGESAIVQICGVKGLSDLDGAYCHITHPISKRTNKKYTSYVKCSSQDEETSGSCPICNCQKEHSDFFNGKETVTKEFQRQYIVPIVVVDLNMKWDKDAGAFVHKKDRIEGQVVDATPEIKFIRKPFKKLLIKRIFEFVKANGDLTNKVVEIKAVPPKDGKSIGFDYDITFVNEIQPVNETELGVPTNKFEAAQILDKTVEEMNNYVNTDSFFVAKNGGENVNASTPITPRETTPVENANESLNDLPNVNYRRG